MYSILYYVVYFVVGALWAGGDGAKGESMASTAFQILPDRLYRLEMHATVVCLKEAGLGFISNVSVLSNNISSVVMCGSKKTVPAGPE